MKNEILCNVSTYAALKPGFVVEELSNLLGQVLTIVDASTDGDKNTAMKSLIKEKFSSKQNYLNDLGYKQEEVEGANHHPRYEWEDSLVPYEADKRYCFR